MTIVHSCPHCESLQVQRIEDTGLSTTLRWFRCDECGCVFSRVRIPTIVMRPS
jgi:formate dehydrogenase maturation protein FdhE